jgi:hypothetical protein
MSTDPNWLYSTIAQSAAAIVAIIGGFITSSVISLNAEKRSLINQVKVNKTTLKKYRSKNIAAPNLEVEIPILEGRIKAFSYPPYLRFGALILVLLAFFSIIMPVYLIMQEIYDSLIKQITFGLFLACLGAIIAYVALIILELRRK